MWVCAGSEDGNTMALTVYEAQAHGHDWNHDDYGHVNIIYRYGNSKPRPRPDWCKRMEAMWADKSVYGRLSPAVRRAAAGSSRADGTEAGVSAWGWAGAGN